ELDAVQPVLVDLVVAADAELIGRVVGIEVRRDAGDAGQRTLAARRARAAGSLVDRDALDDLDRVVVDVGDQDLDVLVGDDAGDADPDPDRAHQQRELGPREAHRSTSPFSFSRWRKMVRGSTPRSRAVLVRLPLLIASTLLMYSRCQ